MRPARPRRLRFLPLAPLCVIVLGISAALVVAWVGVRQLDAQESGMAEWRARLFSEFMAARLSATPGEDVSAVLDHGARRFEAAVVFAEADGTRLSSAGRTPTD